MAGVWVRQIDDPLPSRLGMGGVLVDDWNPPQRLLRRGDVVAVGGEDHERVADAAQIGRAALANGKFTLLELVADEKILDDGEDFLAAQEIEAIPAPLELETAFSLGVDVREEVRVFFKDRFRLQIIEIRD